MSIKWPRHAAGMSISHNEHKNVYETVEQYIRPFGAQDPDDSFVSEEERQKAIETNELWEIHWYPDTPVGFYRVRASTFEAALAGALEAETQ